MKHLKIWTVLFLTTILLSGCLYPTQSLTNLVPYEQQMEDVQRAVTKYWEENDGILPIKTKEESDIYIKYLIDFNKLVPFYLSTIPANAFENGGIYQYVIVDPEEEPTVKVLDLTIAEQIRDIRFRLSSKKYPPFDQEIDRNVFSLRYEELGYKVDPVVVSPFTGNNLPIYITGYGDIIVDYSSDLYLLLKDKGIDDEIYSKDDIRYLLLEDSYFVPAYSVPYVVDENGDVIFSVQK